MDGNELANWKKLYAICPFGPVRGDLQAGIVARTLYAVHGARRVPGLSAFILQCEPRDKDTLAPAAADGRVTADQLRDLAAAMGIPFTASA